ncbi:tRNA-splicing endonuclease subunit Sen2 [Mycena sanguinolenta]|uniref:tRNA-splicing endonuclease subunit Sen2 n=1 Tax=Mycena sanguinolenta TaxID=230812 RepID=A0A8H7DDX8_9AGAR|nr:tRNA-splicing endonuclease subunit Sen2 [Mycena sanguinolenta]
MSLIKPSGRKGPVSGKAAGRRNNNNQIYAHALPIVFSHPPPTRVRSLLGLLGFSLTKVEVPQCQGIFDEATRSVWVSSRNDSTLLWRRGFFGKGDLSRSEPSWLERQINARQAGGKRLTSEEMTSKRRAERKQFKIDRARAIAAVAAEAEAAFANEGRVIVPALSGPSIPSAATWKPAPRPTEPPDTPEDLEHLQLTLPEAFFLMWNLNCLTVEDPLTNELMSIQQIWIAFQAAHLSPPLFVSPRSTPELQFDNPFLINYIVYHHYRSLGWVVRGGIKFCVDYMLYKRGPVFNHAEFSVVVCPVYEDPADQEASSIDLHHSSPFAWSWLSTINRVNTQVFKTLILAYVTIPARSRVSLDVLDSPACLQYYSVREVTVRRFIPARMRD